MLRGVPVLMVRYTPALRSGDMTTGEERSVDMTTGEERSVDMTCSGLVVIPGGLLILKDHQSLVCHTE